MMAVGCDLNGLHYENGEAFQPSPLYKCTCIGGAVGCTPVFVQKPAALLGPAPLTTGGNTPAGLRARQGPGKHQQDTGYMSGVCSDGGGGTGARTGARTRTQSQRRQDLRLLRKLVSF